MWTRAIMPSTYLPRYEHVLGKSLAVWIIGYVCLHSAEARLNREGAYKRQRGNCPTTQGTRLESINWSTATIVAPLCLRGKGSATNVGSLRWLMRRRMTNRILGRPRELDNASAHFFESLPTCSLTTFLTSSISKITDFIYSLNSACFERVLTISFLSIFDFSSLSSSSVVTHLMDCCD